MRYVDLGKTVEKHQNMKSSAPRKTAKKNGIFYVVVAVLILLPILGMTFSKGVRALFNPVSIVSNITAPDLKETDGRTNILLLGLDRRAAMANQSVLTDTLLFVSIGRVENNVAMISLPRDLWVSVDGQGGEYYTKINAVYASEGIDDLVSVAEDVLGMPIHYYSIIDFNLFKDSINILGGVEVDVERAFDDFYYPVEGKENDPDLNARYETVHFNAGVQKMDGETALKYVRSRHGNNDEGTDFARSKRQQKVIMAIKDKALSLQTLINIGKLKELYDAYSSNVETNIAFDEIQSFYLLSQQINFNSVRSIVLDDRSGADEGGLLYHPSDTSLYGGAYVLVPMAQNYSQLHAYVQRYIFGDQ